jgi:hypothetical protein
LFFKVTSSIETAAVVEKHREPNAGFGSRQVAKRTRFTINTELEVVQVQIDNCITTLINNRNRYWNKIRTDADDVVGIHFITGGLRRFRW